LRLETVVGKFGPVTEEEYNDIKTFHRGLLDLEREGLKIDVKTLNSLMEYMEGKPGYSKDYRTLMALKKRMDSSGKINPNYDLFRNVGRTFVYSIFPNMHEGFPIMLFKGDLVEVPRKEDVLETIADVASFLRKGAKLGPIIGERVYLDLCA